jgi:Protein of unknown function (DUF2934)
LQRKRHRDLGEFCGFACGLLPIPLEHFHALCITSVNNVSGGDSMSEIRDNFPTHERIKMRAYELYRERGATMGQDLEHWLVAEKDLTEIYIEELFTKLQSKVGLPDHVQG